jgi:hypothetical protein
MQGKPVRLMVDTNHAYGRAEALRLGRALAEYDLRWYEEPVVPEDRQGYMPRCGPADHAHCRRRERAHAVRLCASCWAPAAWTWRSPTSAPAAA